jgi:hypothetical protein
MNSSYQPFLPVTMRLKAGTVFIKAPALSAVFNPDSGGIFTDVKYNIS